MTQVFIKRVYDTPEAHDGFRVLVDRLWPRGMSKASAKYDLWEKTIAPSTTLRQWFHESPQERWREFVSRYRKELAESDDMKQFLGTIKPIAVITLIYGSKDPVHNHAKVLQQYIIEHH